MQNIQQSELAKACTKIQQENEGVLFDAPGFSILGFSCPLKPRSHPLFNLAVLPQKL